jgi:hypothetical protein
LERLKVIERIMKRCFPERILNSYHKLKESAPNKDDFEWSKYNKVYAKQISKIEKNENTLILPDGMYSIVGGKIVLEPSLLPLHPNHKLLYETIYNLNPSSVLEVGFGCGDHLHNIINILPKTEFNGCDLLEDQMRFLLARHPELKTKANLFVHDITLSSPNIRVDLVYTQAVIMHIQKDDNHLHALKNIFKASKKYVVLMENWSRHNFYEDIRKISRDPDFPWENIYIYVNDDGKQILMVITNTTLEFFKEIHTNDEMLKYI